MIAPATVVAQLLMAAIGLLAITFGVLQFYPRIVASWRPKTSKVPISQLVRYASVQRLLRKLKWALGLLALSILIGLLYLLLAATEALSLVVPSWLDVLMVALGLVLLGSAIVLLTLGTLAFRIEELDDVSEE